MAPSPGRAPLAALACLLLCGACGGARSADDGDGPIASFRTALTDPETYPVRDGLALDFDALQEHVRRFGEAHGELVRARLAASVAALRPGEPPGGPWYADVVRVDPALLAEAGRVVTLVEVVEPDVRAAVRRTLGLTLPPALAADPDAPPGAALRWQAFLAAAEPTWRNCGSDPRHLTVCVDYGGLDIFVVELLRAGDLWSPVAVTWWQRQS